VQVFWGDEGDVPADHPESNARMAHEALLNQVPIPERNQGGIADNWGQVTKLRASDAANNDSSGRAVAISGDQVIAGAYGEDGAGSDRGAAYVFSPQPYLTYLPLIQND
jgi:6-phosphogluconolactonase/glucosamine-6-phosphate isomerase/deaminase